VVTGNRLHSRDFVMIHQSLLKTSPFHVRTSALVRAQTWRRWAGYQMASAYDPHP
jgi:hypothetical protein